MARYSHRWRGRLITACLLGCIAAGGLTVIARLQRRTIDDAEPHRLATENAEDQATVASSAANTQLVPQELFSRASPAVVHVIAYGEGHKNVIGLASGFFVSPDGVLASNYHVIQDAVYLDLRDDTGMEMEIDGVLAIDEENDVILLKVSTDDVPYLPLASELPFVGTTVYAIGNPQGLTNTFSEGIVSRIHADDLGANFLQTTAAISAGSSGGPLLTLDGRVVEVLSKVVYHRA